MVHWCSNAPEFTALNQSCLFSVKPHHPLSRHNAPPVTYPLGRSRFQAQLLLMLWLTGAAVIGYWMATAQAINWRHGVGATTVALAGALAWTFWKNSPVGHLNWDSQAWHWESKGYPSGAAEQTVLVALDCQMMMLLQIDNPAHARLWLWAEKRMCAERWLDLRRAVYSPHRAPDTHINLA